MPRTALNAVTPWITEAALSHPATLAEHVAARLEVSRRSANRALRQLVEAQWLVNQGSARRPRHAPGLLRQVVRRYPLEGLDEHQPWVRDFAPRFTLSTPVARLAQHAFTELINNAIDHSGGTQVTVSMRQTASHLQLLISDDGCGLFERIEAAFGIDDPSLATLELSKGKLTSQPERHRGRGLYFTAQLADVLDVHANRHAFQCRAWDGARWHPRRAVADHGTSVFVGIALDSTRCIDTVLRSHSLDGQAYAFERTVVPLHLLSDAQLGLESRAQAKRAAARLPQFRRAEIDFGGIASVGHAFADELFRVFAATHPGIELVPLNMAPSVSRLVDSVRRGEA
ncbi:MAG: ATP-binding protein [Piscinibacter sp.]|nr:ATP-binding protein [Piscinibacter sp.]